MKFENQKKVKIKSMDKYYLDILQDNTHFYFFSDTHLWHEYNIRKLYYSRVNHRDRKEEMVISHVMLLHIYQKHWPINRCYEIFGKKNKKEQIKTKTKHVKVVAGRSLRIQLGNHSYTQWRWRWCCFQWQKKRIWKKKKKRKYETTKQQQTTASFFFLKEKAATV